MQNFSTRTATPDDIPQLLAYIRKLALHEGRPEAATATGEGLMDWLFRRNSADVLMAEVDGKPAGYALYYPIFSTFQGKCNLYLEDVYIDEAYRGMGYGRLMMELMLQKAGDGGYGALQWSCLDSNEGSLRFYETLGAKRKPHGTTFYIPLP